MKMQLLKINGKYAGYTLVAENDDEKASLQIAQSLNFLASNKQEKIEYDGVMLDKNAKVSRIIFMQHQYAAIPTNNSDKQQFYKNIVQEGVPQ